MGKNTIIRVWKEMDADAIKPHLLIAGSTTGDCANCKDIGISFEAKNCPKCGTVFKYIGTRISNSAREAKRLRARRPDLMLIEYDDFKQIQARTKARGLWGD